MTTMQDLLQELAACHGETVAVRDAKFAYTYAGLAERSAQLAGGLLAAGVKPGAVVVWLAGSTPEFMATYLATAMAGLRVLPMNDKLSVTEIQRCIRLVRPQAIIVSPDYDAMADALGDGASAAIRLRFRPDGPQGPGIDELMTAAHPKLPLPAVPLDALHEVLLTSGTTSAVKAVQRTQRHRIAESTAVNARLRVSGRSHQLRLTPQFHMGGIIGPLQGLLRGGTTTVGRFSVGMADEGIRAGANFVAGAPTQYVLMMDRSTLSAAERDHVAYCTIGGSPSGRSELTALENFFPNAEIVQVYGSTEAGVVSTNWGRDLAEHPDSVGIPLKDVDVRFVDDDNRPRSDDAGGNLLVRSPFVMSGYLGEPEPAATCESGHYLTGDVARRDAHGRLYLVGRRRDLIITGGENVYPREVEEALEALPLIGSAYVFPRPDAVFQQVVAAVITLGSGAPVMTPSALAEQLLSQAGMRLARYKVPREIYLTDGLPLSGTGKVDRKAIERDLQSLRRLV